MAGGRSPYEEKVAMIAERDAGLVRLRAELETSEARADAFLQEGEGFQNEIVRLRAENKEMADYLDVIEREVSYAYDAVTFGRFSKPNTAHEYVEEAVQERIEKAVEDAEEPLKDEIGGLRAECERLRAALAPFADAVATDKVAVPHLTFEDFRRAAAALKDEP
jgi:predicted  nucleic acid-binding Zn-ribbon protein